MMGSRLVIIVVVGKSNKEVLQRHLETEFGKQVTDIKSYFPSSYPSIAVNPSLLF